MNHWKIVSLTHSLLLLWRGEMQVKLTYSNKYSIPHTFIFGVQIALFWLHMHLCVQNLEHSRKYVVKNCHKLIFSCWNNLLNFQITFSTFILNVYIYLEYPLMWYCILQSTLRDIIFEILITLFRMFVYGSETSYKLFNSNQPRCNIYRKERVKILKTYILSFCVAICLQYLLFHFVS